MKARFPALLPLALADPALLLLVLEPRTVQSGGREDCVAVLFEMEVSVGLVLFEPASLLGFHVVSLCS